jgi:hypothetical protein
MAIAYGALLVYIVILYLDTRRPPESLLNGPTNPPVQRVRDRITTYLGPAVVVIGCLLYARDDVVEHIDFLQDPWHPGLGMVVGLVLAIGTLIRRML